jgi:hypothetical protein
MTDQPEAPPSAPVDYWNDDDAPNTIRGVRAANIIRIVQTVIFTAVAGFAISVVVAGHWWQEPPPPPPPPPTVNVATVGNQVVSLLRTQWSTGDLAKYGITISDDMTLINTDLNKYDGLATVTTRKGTQKFLEVTVWADPTGAMFYNMDVASATRITDAAREEEPDRCWSDSCG